MAVMHGRDDREKIKEALFWLESGTAKNCPHAMALLGSYYLDGGFTERSRREAERDPEKGLTLLRRAAAMDAPAAHIVLGRIYFNGGCGVARDAEAGLAHFDRAIAAGSRRAACIIAQSYERGYWLGQDYRRAREYYEKARALGEEGLDDRIYNLEHLPDYFWGSHLSVKACAKEEVRRQEPEAQRSRRLSEERARRRCGRHSQPVRKPRGPQGGVPIRPAGGGAACRLRRGRFPGGTG